MIEAGVSASIALLAAIAAVTNRVHARISSLDNRVDRVELRMAENYVSKAEFHGTLGDLKNHMIRIEQKLDTFIAAYPKD
jgi:hypothetical protein